MYKHDISLLIFDEATNAIDSSNEKKIFEAITKYIKGITIIIVSHNKDNLKLCNKILDLDKKVKFYEDNALVPIKLNSQRLKNKNILKLGNKPLS